MNLAAAPPGPHTLTASAVTPDVFIGGQPTDGIHVLRLISEGPLDRRTAELAVAPSDSSTPNHGDGWIGREVAVGLPVHFRDQPDGYLPLFKGEITHVSRTRRSDGAAQSPIARCHWSRMLDAPLAEAIPGGPLASMISKLGRKLGIELTTAALPSDLGRRPADGIIAGRNIGEALEALCRCFGLFIRRHGEWADGRIDERFAIAFDNLGRPVRLGLRGSPSASSVVALNAGSKPTLPLALGAEAAGQVAESTFALLPAWNPADENHPDAAYAKATAGDFEAVRDVFRLWGLNEDASLEAPPFDLTALFDESSFIPPQPIPFGEPLTRDSPGNRLPPVIEYSIDGGATWHPYPATARMLGRRAGVYLDGNALPTGFIDAARTGEASVRITATLRSPLPLTAERWVGNPFTGPVSRRTLRVGDRFSFRRVLPTSRFHGEVTTGERDADTVDERPALEAWLIRRSEGISRDGLGVTLTTASIQPALQVGDRLDRIERRPGDHTGNPPPGQHGEARIARIEHRWDDAVTVLELAGLEVSE